ncbi:MAG TPA: ferric reductase-like transmembrane domain-containing protein [Actinomycetota bacterium]|nr:ferric reductase-like transmembrane domain-containing protein [Actinomycetota bacterium]
MTLWILLRAAGIGAYVALSLAVVWGLVSSTGVITRRVSKPAGNHFHAVIGATGLALLALHMILLVLHDYLPFGPLDVLIPLRGPYRPIAVGLGVLAMYAIVLIMTTSWIKKRLSNRVWRAIHLLAVPAFMLALLHGVLAGTDTQRPAMLLLYGASGTIVVFLILVRALTYGFRPPRPAPHARASAIAERASASAPRA